MLSAHIKNLFRKYLDNAYTESELNEILLYFHLSEDDGALDDLIQQELIRLAEAEPIDRQLMESISAQIEHKLFDRSRAAQRSRFSWFAYAAAAILICTAIGTVILYIKLDNRLKTQLTSRYGDDVLPGGNHATLTLADGSSILLDSAGIGLLAEQTGTTISKEEDGTITYEVTGSTTAPSVSNTITTPKGGQYKVILPDGTQVWLNAESALTYSLAVNGGKRIVELAGEGYFEVAHRPEQPFFVSTGSQTVEVLGTHFNVHAYPDEDAVSTTLLDGAIKIQAGHAAQSVTLAPGQQALLGSGGFDIREVEAADYAAWKDGDFVFNNTELGSIFRQLERWYDIEVEHEKVPHRTLDAVISRDKKLSSVLYMIEASTGLKFRIKERRLSIVP